MEKLKFWIFKIIFFLGLFVEQLTKDTNNEYQGLANFIALLYIVLSCVIGFFILQKLLKKKKKINILFYILNEVIILSLITDSLIYGFLNDRYIAIYQSIVSLLTFILSYIVAKYLSKYITKLYAD